MISVIIPVFRVENYLNACVQSVLAQTYKDLFSFLGDHDKAVESAQSLALITQEEEKLAEWSNILQGAFAQMGDKLPTEALAEAANETIKVGQVTGAMADALNWMGVSEDGFNEALAQTTSLEEREALNAMLVETFGVDESTINAQSISSTVSGEMRKSAVIAVIVACFFMLIYIRLRFKDLRFATSAILALVHDVLVVLAAYALLRITVGNEIREQKVVVRLMPVCTIQQRMVQFCKHSGSVVG